MDEEVLHGGVANRGAVIRVGETVTRPAPANAESIYRLFGHLADKGFEAPRPVGPAQNGRETLRFIPGDVPIPPYPAWAVTDEALESIGVLLRAFHDAVRSFAASGLKWSNELSDPDGDELICHNDICLENVVFRDGRAVALLDFDYAAPGRAIWDLAMTAEMCVPMTDPRDPLPGQDSFDPFDRLVIVARAYGLPPDRSEELVAAIGQTKERGTAFVTRHVDSGHPGFIEMVANRKPGAWERERGWYRDNAERLVKHLRDSLV